MGFSNNNVSVEKIFLFYIMIFIFENVKLGVNYGVKK
jgi:hypothetical protein